jgi:hypothetical protein
MGVRSLGLSGSSDLKMTRHPQMGDPGETAVEICEKELAMTAKLAHSATTETVDHILWARVAPSGPRMSQLGLNKARPLQDRSQIAANGLNLGQLRHANHVRSGVQPEPTRILGP